MTEMILNKADITAVLKAIEDFNVDCFTLVKHSECGIGYCVSIQYETKMHDRTVTVTVPVIDEKDW